MGMSSNWMVCVTHHRILKVKKNLVHAKLHENDVGYYVCDLWICPEDGCPTQLFTGWSTERFDTPVEIHYRLDVQH